MATTTTQVEVTIDTTQAVTLLSLVERLAEGDTTARLELQDVAFGPYCRTHSMHNCPYKGNPHLPC